MEAGLFDNKTTGRILWRPVQPAHGDYIPYGLAIRADFVPHSLTIPGGIHQNVQTALLPGLRIDFHAANLSVLH